MVPRRHCTVPFQSGIRVITQVRASIEKKRPAQVHGRRTSDLIECLLENEIIL
jgi:hypothetical protein